MLVHGNALSPDSILWPSNMIKGFKQMLKFRVMW